MSKRTRAVAGEFGPIERPQPFRLMPLAQAIALIMVAGSAHAQRAFSPAWFGAMGATQHSVIQTGVLPNGKPVSSLTNPSEQQQQANAQLQRSINNLNLTARAIAAQQAAQAAARQAADDDSVPDGLTEGGLKVDTNSLTAGWINAKAFDKDSQKVIDGKTVVTVDQTADKAILNWETFNVGRNTTVDFQQQANWSVLNRVNDPAARPSRILGQITGDGTIMVVNRNGVVFNGSSQVNVRNLVAAAANITDTQFSTYGLYGLTNTVPTFTDALGKIEVLAGASITTHEPQSVTDGGGYVMLLGTEVSNAGEITTRKGQTELAAGNSFLIRKGFGTDANAFSTTRGSEIAPQFVADGVDTDGNPVPNTAGKVSNTGLILAREGDITLTGRDVRQDGAAVSTTTVNTRGTIHLLTSANDDRSSVTLGKDATTAIVVEDDGKTTALDAQRDALIKDSAQLDQQRINAANLLGKTFDNLSTMSDRRDLSRVEIVGGGDVNFEDGSLTLATGGQLAVSSGNSLAGTKETATGGVGNLPTFGSIRVDGGAQLDVSGSIGVKVTMESNNIAVNVQGNELRDAPLNRDAGKLFNSNIWVDRRDLVLVPAGTGGYDSDRWYTAGGLLEVSGYLGNQGHTVGEWTAPGGIVTLAGDSVLTEADSHVNLSGGTLDVQTGRINTTWLKGSDGRIYSAGRAPADLLYNGVYVGFEDTHQRWDVTNSFFSPLIAPQSRLENGYTVGRDAGSFNIMSGNAILDGHIDAGVYNGPRQIDTRPSSVTDAYKLSQTQAALAGRLSVQTYDSTLRSDLNSPRLNRSADLHFDNERPADDQLVDQLQLQGNLFWFNLDRLNEAGLGGLSAKAFGDLDIGGDLTLAPGGALNLEVSGGINLDGNLTARSGSVRLVGNVSLLGDLNGLTLKRGVTIDTRGLWTNTVLDPDDAWGIAFRNGGSVSLTTYGAMLLGDGSRIDASSGGALMGNGSVLGGVGGDITLSAGGLVVDGGAELVSYGFSRGGKLSINTPGAISIGGTLLQTSGVLAPGELAPFDLTVGEAFTIPAGTKLDYDLGVRYEWIMLGAPLPSSDITGSINVSYQKPITVGPNGWTPPVGGVFALDKTGQSNVYEAGQLIPAGYRVYFFQQALPEGYFLPADAFTGPIPLYPKTITYKAGTVIDKDLVVPAGTMIARGTSLAVAAPVLPTFDIVDASAFFQQGFSSYNLSGAGGLVVQPDAQVDVAMPIYQFSGASRVTGAARQTLSGDELADAVDVVLPPLFTEDPAHDTLTQRAGADLALSGGFASSLPGRPVSVAVSGAMIIGEGSVINVDPGHRVDLTSKGQLTVDGTISAPGGAISIVNSRTMADIIHDPNNPIDVDPTDGLSVWIGSHAKLDVAGRAYTALDSQGYSYGTVFDGGSVLLGGAGGPSTSTNGVQSTSTYVIVRPGALIDASGASAVLDLVTDTGRVAKEVASDGGSITVGSYNGFFLDGDIRATAGGAGASGGSLSLVLEAPLYKGYGVDPATLPGRVLTVGQYYLASDLPDDLAPATQDDGFVIGRSRISAEQIEQGGFDSLSLWGRNAIYFNGDVDLHLGRSLTLQQGYLYETTAGANVKLSAPYVLFEGGTQLRTSDPNTPAVAPTQLPEYAIGGTLTVESALMDLRNAVRLNFDQTVLQSSGDMRFLVANSPPPDADQYNTTLRTTDLRAFGNLELAAAQIYPASGATVSVIAGTGNAAGDDDFSLLSIRSTGDVPAQPYSVLGNLSLNADVIRQGGVVRVPFGTLSLNATQEIDLLDGSITSVSTRDLVIPFGGTVDGVTYTYNGVDAVKPDLISGGYSGVLIKGEPGISGNVGVQFNTKSVVGDAGSLIDLSGGGQFTGAAFITGRGGSVDTLLNPLNAGGKVYAIVPGVVTAPAPGGAANAWTGTAPAIGQQITLPAGVPGLAAGTYTLLPANYAMLPGAFRVELGGATDTFAGPLALRNGSYAVTGVQGVANTDIRDTLGTLVTVTSGKTLRTYSAYNEQSYSQFQLSQAQTFGTLRPLLEGDGKRLVANVSVAADSQANSALVFNGRADFSAGEQGYDGSFALVGSGPADTSLIITGPGSATQNGASTITVAASEIDKIAAPNLLIGGTLSKSYYDPNVSMSGTIGNEYNMVENLVLESGVKLTGAQVVLGANRKITLETGASISTLGHGFNWIDSSSGLLFGDKASPYGSRAILLVSNGLFRLDTPSGLFGTNIELHDGTSVYSEGTIGFYSDLGVTLDGQPTIGTRNLSLAVPSFNIGTDAALAAAGTLPQGMVLNQGILDSLFAGNPAVGAPALENLVLTAAKSINFFGNVDLDTIDPATGKSRLDQLVFNSPAIYGYGGAGDTVHLTTGTLVWNDTLTRITYTDSYQTQYGSAQPGALLAGGPGSGHFKVDADTIVFGNPTPAQPNTTVRFDRLMLGFSEVEFNAADRITANARGTVSFYQSGADPSTEFDPDTYVGNGGTLRLNTPMLTGTPGAVIGYYVGGALNLAAPEGSTASAAKQNDIGAQIDLHAGSIAVGSAIMLPSGKLTMTADRDITLAEGSRLDVSGRTLAFFDQTRDTWGGDIVIESRHGDIVQAAGSTIDVSAAHEDAGSLRVSALDAAAGRVRLDGTLLGSGGQGHDGGRFDLRAQRIGDSAANLSADFAALNTTLSDAGFFGARAFDFKQGNLAIGDELKAHDVSVSLDAGTLTVHGHVDASGEQPGSIRLAAHGDLELASTAVLDTHGTVLQVDSYGQAIEAKNRGTIELTSATGWLRLDDGTTLDVSAPDGVARGRVTLDARRANETGGDVLVDASGNVNVQGASSIAVNGFWTYMPTDADGTIVQDTGAAHVPAGAVGLDQIDVQSQAFYANALANGALQSRLAGLKRYGDAYHLRPGVEITSREPDGKLTIAGDLDLSGYRYGPNADRDPASAHYGAGEPLALVIRAGGDLDVKGSITDGFGKPNGTPDDSVILLAAGATLTADYTLLDNVTLGVGTKLGTGAVLPFDLVLQDGQVLRAGQAAPHDIVLHPPIAPEGDPLYGFGGMDRYGTLFSPVLVVAGQVDDDYWNGQSFYPGDYIYYALGEGAVIHAGTILSSPSSNPNYADVVLLAGPKIAADKALPQAVKLATDYTLSAAVQATGTIVTPGKTWTAGMTIPAGTVLPSGTTLDTGASLPFDFDILGTTWVKGNPLVFAGGYTLTTDLDLTAGTVLPAGTNLSTDIQSVVKQPVWAVAPMLAAGSQSASIRLVGGADLAAADTRTLQPASTLGGAGKVTLDNLRISNSSRMPIFSVIRTGTGDLDILAGGDFTQASPFSVYTAGTQSDLPSGNEDFNLPRVMSSNSLIAGYPAPKDYNTSLNDQATWFPDHGGDLLIVTQGDLTDNVWQAENNASYNNYSVASWLWRQGGEGMGQKPAWSINFGSYIPVGTIYHPDTGITENQVGVIGFDGFGALGGGNVTLQADGNAGILKPYSPYSEGAGSSTGLTVAVGATGRVIPTANGSALVQTGGGDVVMRIGGGLNPAQAVDKLGGPDEFSGTFTDLRGDIGVNAGSIGAMQLAYGTKGGQDPRGVDLYTASHVTLGAGGPAVVPGDGEVSLRSRGDLVLGGVGDATMLMGPGLRQYQFIFSSTGTLQSNLSKSGIGISWFSLWTPETAISLFSAGGNLAPFWSQGGGFNERKLATPDGLVPSRFEAVAGSGSIYYGSRQSNSPSTFELAPSAQGQLEMLAMDSIYADGTGEAGARVGMSGARAGVDYIPNPFKPAWVLVAPNFAGDISGVVIDGNIGYGTNTPVVITPPQFEGLPPTMAPRFGYFAFQVADTPADVLHADDPDPMRIYAVNGDIVGMSLGASTPASSYGAGAPATYMAAKATQVRAGRDIVAFGLGSSNNPLGTPSVIMNANDTDVSVIEAGRDIFFANVNIAGPGTLEVTAGRNLYQGSQGGLVSIGPVIPGDTRPGADIVAQVGFGATGSAGADYAAVAARYLNPANQADLSMPLAEQPGKVAHTYDKELAGWLTASYGYTAKGSDDALAYFGALPAEQQHIFLRTVYYDELREGGREYNDPESRRFNSYLRGRQVIATLFPEQDADGHAIERGGNLIQFGPSGIQTQFGGDIQLLVPNGQITVGVQGEAPPATAGLITQGEGDIELYSSGSILLGLSRIMTTFGGDILAWSAEGDINAGRGSKTTLVYTPPKRVYDTSGNVRLSPQVPSSGAGIATLNPIPEVPAGDVDLIAPLGTIDAGEAGIRVSGNLNIAALHVVNAENIQVQGKSMGLPVVASVNVGALTNASAAAAQATIAAQDVVQSQRAAARQALPSVFTVRVLGFGNEPATGNEAPPAPRVPGEKVGYDRNSPVQVLGRGPLNDAQKARLTVEERRLLGL